MKTPQAVNNYNFSTLYIANRTNGASILELICYTIILLLFFSIMKKATKKIELFFYENWQLSSKKMSWEKRIVLQWNCEFKLKDVINHFEFLNLENTFFKWVYHWYCKTNLGRIDFIIDNKKV